MEIVAIQESFVDYPEHFSLVFFVKDCNWNCIKCQNKTNLHGLEVLSTNYIYEFIKGSGSLFQHYVISGGEPTCYTDLVDFIKFIRDINPFAKIKLDTNGSNPNALVSVLPLLDAVSMDIKTSFFGDDFSRYEEIVRCRVTPSSIRRSIAELGLFSKRGKYVEFRTTLVDNSINIDQVVRSIKEVLGGELGNIKYTINDQIINQNRRSY